MANIIVVVDYNHDSILCGCFREGGQEPYVRGKYMAELKFVKYCYPPTRSRLATQPGAITVILDVGYGRKSELWDLIMCGQGDCLSSDA